MADERGAGVEGGLEPGGHLLVYASVVVLAVGAELAIEEAGGADATASLLAIGSTGVVVATSVGLTALDLRPPVTAVILAVGWITAVAVSTVVATPRSSSACSRSS